MLKRHTALCHTSFGSRNRFSFVFSFTQLSIRRSAGRSAVRSPFPFIEKVWADGGYSQERIASGTTFLDALAVDNCGARTGFAYHPFAIGRDQSMIHPLQHGFVVQTCEPEIQRRRGRKILRQQPPCDPAAQGVQMAFSIFRVGSRRRPVELASRTRRRPIAAQLCSNPSSPVHMLRAVAGVQTPTSEMPTNSRNSGLSGQSLRQRRKSAEFLQVITCFSLIRASVLSYTSGHPQARSSLATISEILDRWPLGRTDQD